MLGRAILDKCYRNCYSFGISNESFDRRNDQTFTQVKHKFSEEASREDRVA